MEAFLLEWVQDHNSSHFLIILLGILFRLEAKIRKCYLLSQKMGEYILWVVLND
ncbi:unnamed protein product [Meloidogyne enterolobii]|uniref:Uncharacterized protein n=1 Tax=Meloidogyne enterolobii TaxID=390850 RepID=A0ACB0XUZ8_MELEN